MWLVKLIIASIEIVNNHHTKKYKNYLAYLKKSKSILKSLSF